MAGPRGDAHVSSPVFVASKEGRTNKTTPPTSESWYAGREVGHDTNPVPPCAEQYQLSDDKETCVVQKKQDIDGSTTVKEENDTQIDDELMSSFTNTNSMMTGKSSEATRPLEVADAEVADALLHLKPTRDHCGLHSPPSPANRERQGHVRLAPVIPTVRWDADPFTGEHPLNCGWYDIPAFELQQQHARDEAMAEALAERAAADAEDYEEKKKHNTQV